MDSRGRSRTRRDDQLAMLSRLEWLVLRSGCDRFGIRRWFARASADAPELAIRLGPALA
jgi:hypothetical protein